MGTDEDADLRRSFAGLRSEDARNVPSFEATVAAARRSGTARRGWLIPAATGTVAAVAATLAVIAVVRRPEPRSRPSVSIEEWTAPTDFLLETPGRELLETVPSIGELPAAAEDGDAARRRSVSP